MIRKLAMVSLMSILLVSGCGDTFEYIGALSTLASNTADPPVGNLTATQIVALSNHAADLGALLNLTPDQVAAIPSLTTDQAQVIVDFMDDNNITSVSDLQTIADEIANGNPNNIVIPPDLEALAESMGFEI